MRLRGGTEQAVLAALTALALAIFVGLPFVFILLQAIFPRIGAGSFKDPFAHFAGLVSAGDLPIETANSLLLGVGTVALSAVLAIPLAALRALTRLPGAVLWDLLFLLPFMVPPYIASLGWILTLQPAGYMQQLCGVNLAWFLFSVPGIVFVLTMNTFPVVYFALSRSFTAIGGRYAEVSRVAGATPLRAFIRVTLPLSWPSLAASLLLVFAMAIEEYGTPAVLGTRIGFRVLVTGIDGSISDWPVDLPKAALLSLVLVGLATLAFFLQRRLLVRRGYETTTGRAAAAPPRAPLGRWRWPVLAGFAIVAFLASGVPLLAILATALSRTISGGLVPANLGLQNFRAIVANSSGAFSALVTSLGLALITALSAGLLGTLTAYVASRTNARLRGFIELMAALPNAAPGVVVALGLILLWNQPALPVTPYNTLAILLLAYVFLLLPQPVRFTTAALHQIGPSLEAAARVSGASAVRTLGRVLLPLLLPNLLAAMLLSFVVASRELVASLLVLPVGRQTIGTFIWSQFDQGSVGLGMAMAFVTIVVTTLLPLTVLIVARRAEAAL